MAERWLRCEIRKGMFSDEMVVVITTLSGEVASFFVPIERVFGSANQEGRVKVRTFKDDSRAWAALYHTYTDLADFEKAFRQHLAGAMNDLLKKHVSR